MVPMSNRSLFVLAYLVSAAFGICPDLCNCDDTNLIVTCIKAGLDTMPNTLNPQLRTIVYKYNEFPIIHFSLTFLPALVKVDLSHNRIITISNRAFERQGELRQLRLEGNKLSRISNETFYGLTRLKVLILRGNLIESLSTGLFGYSTRLEEIDLGRNRLSNIHETVFDGLSSLRILNLEDNDLSSIPMEALKRIPDLAELRLAGNRLKIISNGALSFFRRLAVLDLSSTHISRLDDHSFSGLEMLRRLKLADNNFSVVPSESFKHVPNLEYLDFGRNPLQVLSRSVFRHLSKLIRIEISGCGRLQAVESEAFLGCVDLEHVAISLNRHLTFIAGDAFDAMPKLRFLSLADNALRNLSESISVVWTRLKAVDLAGNPWNCDCNMTFLAEAVRQLQIPGKSRAVVVDGKCSSPPLLRHRALSELVCAIEEEENNNIRQEPQERIRTPVSLTVVIALATSLALVLVLSVMLFLAFRSRRLRDWVKALKWQNPEQKSALQEPYVYRRSSCSREGDHYLYVSTTDRLAGEGQHIPVTEL